MFLQLVFILMDTMIHKLMNKLYEEIESFKPDILLTDHMNLEQYGFDGVILHCPGHTDGSIAILDSAGNLICGDIFANNNKPSLAINAKDFNQMEHSANELLSNQIKMIYPGHGKPFEGN